MAIKKNAQKLLLALFTDPNKTSVMLPITGLRHLVPDMSEGGYRSLLLFLERKNFLFREKVFGSVSVGLTEEGRNALLSQFPALDERWRSWNGRWMVLIFLEAPKSDPNFRYLRQLLLAEKSLVLSRGVYLAAGSFSNRVLMETKQLYHQSVAILSAETWHIGLQRPLIVSYYDLTSRVESYSGFSKEVTRLLEMSDAAKKLNNQQKSALCSLFDRVVDSLRDDPGFTSYYFPDYPGISPLIAQLQKVIML